MKIQSNKMRLHKTLIFILVAIIFSSVSTVRTNELKPIKELKEQKPWVFVSELIKDCSQKHPSRSDILMLNVDKRSSEPEKIMKEVSEFYPVFSGNPNLCLKRMEYNLEFVIITTQNLVEVNTVL